MVTGNGYPQHIAQLTRGLFRCYPNHVHFMRRDGEGQNDLRQVLTAYAQYNPDLGYCQGMHCLAGCMLMQMPAEVGSAKASHPRRFSCQITSLHAYRMLFGYWWQR